MPNTLMKPLPTHLLAIAVSIITAAALSAASVHDGTWKFNSSKSKLPPGTGHNDTVSYQEGANGIVKLTADGVDKDGKPVHWTWQGRFDGKGYKVKAKGTAPADTIAYRVVNDHTNSLTAMKGGQVVMTGTIKVANDGKSRVVTTTSTMPDGKKVTSKSYYDKQ